MNFTKSFFSFVLICSVFCQTSAWAGGTWIPSRGEPIIQEDIDALQEKLDRGPLRGPAREVKETARKIPHLIVLLTQYREGKLSRLQLSDQIHFTLGQLRHNTGSNHTQLDYIMDTYQYERVEITRANNWSYPSGKIIGKIKEPNARFSSIEMGHSPVQTPWADPVTRNYQPGKNIQAQLHEQADGALRMDVSYGTHGIENVTNRPVEFGESRSGQILFTAEEAKKASPEQIQAKAMFTAQKLYQDSLKQLYGKELPQDQKEQPKLEVKAAVKAKEDPKVAKSLEFKGGFVVTRSTMKRSNGEVFNGCSEYVSFEYSFQDGTTPDVRTSGSKFTFNLTDLPLDQDLRVGVRKYFSSWVPEDILNAAIEKAIQSHGIRVDEKDAALIEKDSALCGKIAKSQKAQKPEPHAVFDGSKDLQRGPAIELPIEGKKSVSASDAI